MNQTAQPLTTDMSPLPTEEGSSFQNLLQVLVMTPLWIVALAGFFTLSVGEVYAANNNQQINFQGKIVNKTAGTNITDGTYSFTFKIYDAASGGNQLWSETQSSVTVTSGIFQVALGSVTPLSSLNFTNPNLWLDITFNGETFGTRIQLGAVPTAIDALNVDGVVATQSASGFTFSGGTNTVSTVSFTTSGSTLTLQPGNAGALTLQSNGANGLTIDTGGAAALAIGATANSIAFGATNNPSYSFNGTGAFTVAGGGNNNITFGSNGGTGTIVIQPNAGGQASLIVNNQGSGDIFTASASGNIKFTIGNTGAITDLNYAGANAVLYAAPTTGLVATATTTTGSQCLLSQTGSSGTPIWGSCSGVSPSLQTAYNAGQTIDLSQAGTGLTLGTNAGTQNVVIAPNAGGQAALIINKQNTVGDILTASSSGTTRFTIGNAGNTAITSANTSALAVGANGVTNPVFQVDASTGSVATGLKVLGAATGGTTAVSVIDSGSNANLSIDAKGTGTITIGGTSTGNIIIGGATNGLTFSTTTGPSYAGTGRPTKQIVLSAEYAGAVLTASGSANIIGSMTSDASPSATPTSYNWQNYYQWAATSDTSPTLQDYYVAVRVTLPKDFSAWATGNCLTVAFNTPFTSNALNALDVYLYQAGDSSGNPIAFRTGQVSSTSKNWTTVNFTSSDFSGSKTWNTAGTTAVIYLKMRSTNTPNYVQVGDITLNYLAAF